MKQTDLKPCPFCGGKAVIRAVSKFQSNTTVGFEFNIQCGKCMAKYPEVFKIGFYLTEEGEIRQGSGFEGVIDQAKELWNRRFTDERAD